MGPGWPTVQSLHCLSTLSYGGDISVFFQNSDQKEIEKCCWGEKKFQKLKSAQYERSCPPRWLKFTTIHWNWKTWTFPEHITEITLIHYRSNMCGENWAQNCKCGEKYKISGMGWDKVPETERGCQTEIWTPELLAIAKGSRSPLMSVPDCSFYSHITGFCQLEKLSIFSCPKQLNRWPCHSLTQSVTHSLLLLTYKEQS